MKLSTEQERIIATNEDIRINAVAGSGKTTTLIEYAKSRPRNARILYLAFNRSVRTEAVKRFSDAGLGNVQSETAHSLAHRYVARGRPLNIRAEGYKSHEVAIMLGLKDGAQKHESIIIGNHIRKFAAYFCNSNRSKVQDLDYREVVSDPKSRLFVDHHYERILQGTRRLLAEMHHGKTAITHDYYLKQFQLHAPALPYDHILFDEGQDASGAMLDVFLKQKAVKVIVGDVHQQIYGWRHAVNSLEQAQFPGYTLQQSFRFNQVIAGLAGDILGWKAHLKPQQDVRIIGAGGGRSVRSRATIARSNLNLLIKAIGFMESNPGAKVYFEGNFSSYTYAAEGASIYDVYNLYYGKRSPARDPLIRSMKSMDELQDYIEKTEDRELAMTVELINEYGRDLPNLLQKLRDCNLGDENKQNAGMVFSTVHRSKGMEYDEVILADDFISEEKIIRQLRDADRPGAIHASLNEEINLLYVAATRTRNILRIPEQLCDRQPEDNLHIIRPPAERVMPKQKQAGALAVPKTLDQRRAVHKNAYQRWTEDADEELTQLFISGKTEKELAAHFKRNPGSINARIRKLELYEKYR